MKRAILIIILLILFIFFGVKAFQLCTRTPRVYGTIQTEKVPVAETVSIMGLLAEPQRFAGKQVKTEGWVRFGFENHALYLHTQDDKKHLSLNSVRLVLNAEEQNKKHVFEAFDKTYCVVIGYFCPRSVFLMDIHSGSITNVTYIYRLD